VTEGGGKYISPLNISKRDTQVIYSMLVFSGIAELKSKVSVYNTADANPLAAKAPSGGPHNLADDLAVIDVDITLDGKKYFVTGDESAFKYSDVNAAVSGFCQFAWFILDYAALEPVPKLEEGTVLINVPYISQYPLYPTGCESVSAVMALRYAGMTITVGDFIDGFLVRGYAPYKAVDGKTYGSDPWQAFPGDPYSEDGFGCYAPVIVNSVNKAAQGSKLKAYAIYGVSVEELCSRYVDNGTPVILWATMGMKEHRYGKKWRAIETDRQIDWIIPMHCLLLVGYDGDYYYFNDPQTSKMYGYEKESVEAAYAGMYSQAVVVVGS